MWFTKLYVVLTGELNCPDRRPEPQHFYLFVARSLRCVMKADLISRKRVISVRNVIARTPKI
jgi:hypothetical protein